MKLSTDMNALIPIGDPLHLWKNLRARFQVHSIALFENSLLGTDYERTKTILNLCNVMDDKSKAGKMKDNYVLKLNTFDNVKQLLMEDDYVGATFIFPVYCGFIFAYGTVRDLPFRLLLLELIFQMLSLFHALIFLD